MTESRSALVRRPPVTVSLRTPGRHSYHTRCADAAAQKSPAIFDGAKTRALCAHAIAPTCSGCPWRKSQIVAPDLPNFVRSRHRVHGMLSALDLVTATGGQ